MTGVRLNGSRHRGRPEVSSSAESRLGTVFSQAGATVVDLAEHPRTSHRRSQARVGPCDGVNGVASSHAAVSTTTSCTATPMTRVEGPDRAAVDRAADRPSQHHTGDLTDDDQRQDQEQRGEQLGSRRGDVADDVRREQHAGDGAEQHTDERQQRTQLRPNANPRSPR